MVRFSATPATTGTRPPTTSLAAFSTSRFSAADKEPFSPTVPSMISPWTPLSSNHSMCLAFAGKSMLSSELNCVVTAGKTPCQPMAMMVLLSSQVMVKTGSPSSARRGATPSPGPSGSRMIAPSRPGAPSANERVT